MYTLKYIRNVITQKHINTTNEQARTVYSLFPYTKTRKRRFKVGAISFSHTLCLFYSSSFEYLGFSSSIRLIKSVFSRQPSQFSSQSFRIFFRSRTLSFFKSTVFRSICFSANHSHDDEIHIPFTSCSVPV